MRAVVQRVKHASVSVDGEVTAEAGAGIIVFIGVHISDTDRDCEYIADKIVNLRIFPDFDGKMNQSLLDVKGNALLISQFTLYGDTRKGRRPSYNEAADPAKGNLLYSRVVSIVKETGLDVKTGSFGKSMLVDYVNDGPVTILIDSEKKF